ncbi:ABC transporter permease [Marinicrinis sediminis]|uniref:ABC transporter permease n=1 Tax=Marinicrinis sediminis TaxID=1652465 RepID=A0ABW5RET4_9BACL
MKERLLDLTFRYGAIFVIIAVFIYFSVTQPYFLNFENMMDILKYISIVTLVGTGITISLVVDGFDLSVGSTVSLATVVAASLMVWYEMPLVLVILVPLLLGALVGLLNAFLIVRIGIPDLLATLAVMYIIGGVHRTYTEGYNIHNYMNMPDGTKAPGAVSDSFLWLGKGEVAGVPVPVILMLVTIVIVHLFLNYTRWGRQMYITGGNQEAARLSGIRVNRIRYAAYMMSGALAAMGGVLFAARVGSGQIDAGAPFLMEGVAAVFVGFSVFGAGKPNILGTFLGSLLIGILLNGLTMQNLPYYAYDIVKGTVLVMALAVTFVHLKRRKT